MITKSKVNFPINYNNIMIIIQSVFSDTIKVGKRDG